jgi:hypothetical protein
MDPLESANFNHWAVHSGAQSLPEISDNVRPEGLHY